MGHLHASSSSSVLWGDSDKIVYSAAEPQSSLMSCESKAILVRMSKESGGSVVELQRAGLHGHSKFIWHSNKVVSDCCSPAVALLQRVLLRPTQR